MGITRWTAGYTFDEDEETWELLTNLSWDEGTQSLVFVGFENSPLTNSPIILTVGLPYKVQMDINCDGNLSFNSGWLLPGFTATGTQSSFGFTDATTINFITNSGYDYNVNNLYLDNIVVTTTGWVITAPPAGGRRIIFIQ